MALSDLKTTEDYLKELGRAQKAYQEYDKAGRSDLQQNASNYGQDVRNQAKAAGIDLNQYGTANQYGRDYTSYYTGNGPAGAYDPSKSGFVERNAGAPPVVAGGGGGGIDIGGMYNNMYLSQLQKLRDMKEQQLAGLAGQDDLIKQSRVQSLNNNDVMAAQQLKALREAQANAGVNGGDSITAQIANQTAQGQNANAVEMDTTNKLKQLAAMRDQINNSSSADELALLQGIQAQQAQAQLAQYNTDRNFGLNLGQLLGNYNGQRTLAGQQFDAQQAQQQWDNQFKQGQFDYQKASDQWERTFKEKSFDQSVKQAAANLGLDWARLNQQQQQWVADMAFKQKTFQMEQDKFDWTKNPNNPDNLYKNAQIKEMTDKAKEVGIDEYDLLTVESLADKAGVSIDSAKPEEIKSFVAGLKSQHGWTTAEAQAVESYLNAKASAGKAQLQSQANSSMPSSPLPPYTIPSSNGLHLQF